MRRPQADKDRFGLITTHHLIEAMDMQCMIDVSNRGLDKYLTDEDKLLNDDMKADDLSLDDCTLLAAYSTIAQIHNAIHDLMKNGNEVTKISNPLLRRTVKEHIPNAIAAGHAPQEAIEMLSEVLGINYEKEN